VGQFRTFGVPQSVAQAIDVGSMDFNGTVDVNYDRVTIPIYSGGNPTTANIGSTDFTLEYWLRASASGNNGSGGAWWNGNITVDRDMFGGATRAYGMSIRAGVMCFYCYPNGQTPITIEGGGDLRNDTWVHIAATYNRTSGGTQLYVNGSRVATGSPGAGDVSLATESGTAKNNLIELGGEKHAQGTPSLNGLMSEFRLSNVLRYTGASYTVPTSPLGVDGNTVGYWTFDENTGTVLTDRAGSANGTRVLNGGSPPPSWSTDSPYA
jgi:hypothetical protein